MTLERNPDFWGENTAKVDTLLVRWITEGTQQAPALQNGEVDVIFPQAQLDLVAQVRAIPTATTFIGFGTFWEHLDFNQHNAHLAEPAVRRAIALAIDREEIVQRLPAQFDPSAQVLNNRIFFPADDRYVDNSGDYATQDIEAATAALEDAGYTLGADGVYAHPEKGRLSLRITWRDPNERRQSTAQLIQAQTKEAGIEINFAPQPDFVFLDERQLRPGPVRLDRRIGPVGRPTRSTGATAARTTARTSTPRSTRCTTRPTSSSTRTPAPIS